MDRGNLKELRARAGLSQQQMADRFGIPRRTIQNWENGVSACPEYVYISVSELLNKEIAIRSGSVEIIEAAKAEAVKEYDDAIAEIKKRGA